MTEPEFVVQVLIVTDRDPETLVGEAVTATRGTETINPIIAAAEPYDGEPEGTLLLTLTHSEPFITNSRLPWFVQIAEAPE